MNVQDSLAIRDAMNAALQEAWSKKGDGFGIVGYGIIELRGPDGELKLVSPFANKITDYGDLYYATKGQGGAMTTITGMQIGTSATAPAKAQGLVGTLLSGRALDTGATITNLGAGNGVQIVHVCTYPAAVGTGTVEEATLTNGTIGTASTAGNTIARITTGTIVKAAGDSLAITWNHKFLGA